MLDQLSLFPTRVHDGVTLAYVPNHQERGDDLPRLRESAETMEALVLAWFESECVGVRPYRQFRGMTPTDCAKALSLDLTTVRPRICQLAKRTEGPRLERCKWIKRRPTAAGGSEGYFRYAEGEIK